MASTRKVASTRKREQKEQDTEVTGESVRQRKDKGREEAREMKLRMPTKTTTYVSSYSDLDDDYHLVPSVSSESDHSHDVHPRSDREDNAKDTPVGMTTRVAIVATIRRPSSSSVDGYYQHAVDRQGQLSINAPLNIMLKRSVRDRL